jgi:hypothetical protein
MKTFLRDIQSGLYFRGHGTWTPDPASALNFKLIKRAIKHAEKAGLRGVELVVASEEPFHLTALPVGVWHPQTDSLHRRHD